MLILLPPSQGKSSPRRGKPLDLPSLSFPALTPARTAVLESLIDLCTTRPADEAAAVLGLGPTQMDELSRDASLLDAATTRADRLYTGVLYDALDLPTLAPAGRRRAARALLITSSVFGVVRTGDRLPSYRLSGGVTLPGLGSVAGHWRRTLDPTMSTLAAGRLVVDLRSTTYAAFWRPSRDVAQQVVTVRVLHEKDGTRSVVSHFNKATKGRLVRALLESGESPTTAGALTALLGDLGWSVERSGNRVDVIVTAI